jgi:hypothetical protein
MEGLTPASADDLPPLGELLVDDPFWQHPAWGLAWAGVGHLRVWATATASPGYLALVTMLYRQTQGCSQADRSARLNTQCGATLAHASITHSER